MKYLITLCLLLSAYTINAQFIYDKSSSGYLEIGLGPMLDISLTDDIATTYGVNLDVDYHFYDELAISLTSQYNTTLSFESDIDILSFSVGPKLYVSDEFYLNGEVGLAMVYNVENQNSFIGTIGFGYDFESFYNLSTLIVNLRYIGNSDIGNPLFLEIGYNIKLFEDY